MACYANIHSNETEELGELIPVVAVSQKRNVLARIRSITAISFLFFRLLLRFLL